MLRVLSLLGQDTGVVEVLRSSFGMSIVKGFTLTSSVLAAILPCMVLIALQKTTKILDWISLTSCMALYYI